MQVVGVAANGKYAVIFEDPTPFFYIRMAKISFLWRLCRCGHRGRRIARRAVRNEVHRLAPDLPIIDAQTMRTVVDGTNGTQLFRIGAYFAAAIGGLGLFLAVWVSMAWFRSPPFSGRARSGFAWHSGGTDSDVLRLVLRQGIGMVFAGLLVGTVIALALTRLMARFLLGVSPSDPLTYATVALALSAVAMLACWIPARRATRIDPGVALRYE